MDEIESGIALNHTERTRRYQGETEHKETAWEQADLQQ